jgi:molybdate transport system ATP-binding protein
MTEQSPFLQFEAKKMLHTAQGKQWLDIRFQLDKGSTLAIYGPSGAGKTTLLRILAGLTDVATGHIQLDGETWLDSSRRSHLPTRRRAIGFVFQDFALFPNLTVREQLEYALPLTEDNSPSAVIEELLALMELEALQRHRPAFLSGGQQQRVALARAIARRPKLLLLDEPLSALDEEMRNKLQEYLLKVQQRYHLTTILVSHYLPEISRLADTVLILRNGRIESQGPPAMLFNQQLPVPKIDLPATIVDIHRDGSGYRIGVQYGETTLSLPVSAEKAATLSVGQTVTISVNASNPTLGS